MKGRKIRVTVWNEYVHERDYPAIAAVYPEGIHGCIRRFLEQTEDIAVTCVTLDMPHQGITRELLAETDVLIWWSHARQDEITDETVRLVREAVHAGMGLIALHSAHYSRIMRDLMGTTMTLHWRHGDREKLWCVDPTHPIARGVPPCIDIPKPEELVFIGWFESGHVFRSGVTYTRGRGRIFYFQPGHEEAPVYRQPEIQRIIVNAVRWAASAVRLSTPPDNVAE